MSLYSELALLLVAICWLGKEIYPAISFHFHNFMRSVLQILLSASYDKETKTQSLSALTIVTTYFEVLNEYSEIRFSLFLVPYAISMISCTSINAHHFQ